MRWAAIFDWDGVIVDSSRQHEASWERLAQDQGLSLPRGHFERSFGMKNQRIIPEILGWTHDAERIQFLSDTKELFYRDILNETGIEPLPGVVPWLQALQEAGVPCAVGSSTDRLNITTILDLLGLHARFAGIVSSEDVAHGKPDPEVFVKAAAVLQRLPCECVVFEDAPVGLEAARRAGMMSVGVASTRPADALGGAERVVRRLDELSVDEVGSWFRTPAV